jgi:ribosomal protein L3
MSAVPEQYEAWPTTRFVRMVEASPQQIAFFKRSDGIYLMWVKTADATHFMEVRKVTVTEEEYDLFHEHDSKDIGEVQKLVDRVFGTKDKGARLRRFTALVRRHSNATEIRKK